MALIPCKECGESISAKAYECPHCGFPNRTRSIILEIAAGVLIAAIFIACILALIQK
jgi:hypothetical protein